MPFPIMILVKNTLRLILSRCTHSLQSGSLDQPRLFLYSEDYSHVKYKVFCALQGDKVFLQVRAPNSTCTCTCSFECTEASFCDYNGMCGIRSLYHNIEFYMPLNIRLLQLDHARLVTSKYQIKMYFRTIVDNLNQRVRIEVQHLFRIQKSLRPINHVSFCN